MIWALWRPESVGNFILPTKFGDGIVQKNKISTGEGLGAQIRQWICLVVAILGIIMLDKRKLFMEKTGKIEHNAD